MRNYLHAAFSAMTAILVALTLSACSTLGNGRIDVPEHSVPVIEAAVIYSVSRAVGGDPEAARVVVRAADRVISYVDSTRETKAEKIAEVVRDYLGMDEWAPENRAVGESLIRVLQAQLSDLLEGREIQGEAVLQTITLFKWVRDAAHMALPKETAESEQPEA